MMKKTLLLAITLLFGSSLSILAQGTVSSVNAAGYIKVDTEGGKFYFVQNPFTKFDNSTSFTLSEMIGDTLPDSSQAFVWDAGAQQFSISSFITGLGWFPDIAVERGQGFFVQPAAGTPATSIFLHGQVPGATSFSSTQVDLVPGFSAIGWPYPTEVTLNASGLDGAVADSDQVFAWDAGSQSFQISAFIAGLGFLPDLAIAPGSAVYVSRASAVANSSFDATPGYSWPNN